MSAKVTIKETDYGKAIIAELRAAKELEVAVGLQSDGGGKNGTDIVDIALWNEYGTYAAPARPFVTTTIDNYGSQLEEAIGEGINAILSGGDAQTALDTIGVVGKACMQQNVVAGGFAANSPFTVEGGWAHNKKSGKVFYSEGKKSATPLINTGYMRGQINYVVRAKSK